MSDLEALETASNFAKAAREAIEKRELQELPRSVATRTAVEQGKRYSLKWYPEGRVNLWIASEEDYRTIDECDCFVSVEVFHEVNRLHPSEWLEFLIDSIGA